MRGSLMLPDLLRYPALSYGRVRRLVGAFRSHAGVVFGDCGSWSGLYLHEDMTGEVLGKELRKICLERGSVLLVRGSFRWQIGGL